MKSIEASGKSYQLALEKGLSELQVSEEQVKVETLVVGGAIKQWKLAITVMSDGEIAAAFAEQLAIKMGLDLKVEITENDEEAIINFVGKDSSFVIGYRGEVLDSIQYLCNLVCNIKGGDKRIVVDSEKYRERRVATLTTLAKNLESKAVRTGRNCKLEPMNPYERRIIHATLQDSKFVTTVSEGVAPNRYIVVTLKNQQAKTEEVGKKQFNQGKKKDNRNKDIKDTKKDKKAPPTVKEIEEPKAKRAPYPYMSDEEAQQIDENIVFVPRERPQVNTTVGQKEIKFAFSSSKKKR